MTTDKAVKLPTEKGNADNYQDVPVDARGPRADGTDEIPDRQLRIREIYGPNRT